MLETDLEILEKILRDMNYSPTYISIMLSHLVEKLEDLSLENMTPQFIYVTLAFEEGRHKAREISDYFQEMKETGSYKTNLQKAIDNSPTFSKFK
tara:strand:+ start:1616 stop:1900 length:285 start_codon:yes stop_codon:yes gene_type:complete